jgi:glycosyltransferase involved in cell wall biosynthesis
LSGYKGNILLITTEFPPGPGGIGNHGYNLAKYLSLNEYKVIVLTASDFTDEKSEISFDEKQNFEIIRFKRFSNRIQTYKLRIKKINETVSSNNFTHIIFSGRFSLYASLFLGKFRSRIKFIAIAHGGDINCDSVIEKYFIKKSLKGMRLIIPVSNYSGTKLPSGLNAEKIKVIPNGFDFENIAELKPGGYKADEKRLRLVTVGTIWPRKGHHNVLSALGEILKKYPDTKYTITGRHADLTKVKDYFNDEKIKKHIEVTGQVSNEELYKILKDSEIFILLSESQTSGDFEGFGIAVLEANYFGLPAIGSVNSGLEDAINNGVSGILVNPADTKSITDAIDKIKLNYEAFRNGALEWSLQHHWSKIIIRYINSIEKIN